jgi:hypothetical protein
MWERRQRVGSHVVRIAAGVAALGFVAAGPVLRAPLAAQVVRGAVTERASNEPLAGVLLSVLDSSGATVLQALSDDKGGFEIRLPGAGAYSLDVKRIGVRRMQLPPFTIAAGETRRVDISVEPLPAVLSSVRVTGRTSCVRNPQTNARTAALWDDARAALTAAVITRNLTAGTSDTVVRFQRKLDPNTWRVLYETRRRVSVAMERPFRSLPAEVLSVGGYVTVNQDGSTDYYAPDADVLLSDTFLADHCFKIEPAGTTEHLGQIGLAFQPVPERKKPDIKGVLWMDEKTAELKMLEFSYTWLPNDLRPVDFGGVVSFFHLPGGRWIVRSWRIRMPEFSNQRYTERYDGTYAVAGRSNRPQLVRISEEGGAVPLDVLLNQAGRVLGTVMDTVTKRPIAGITVALAGTSDSTMTAMDGTFELPFVQPGSYTIVLRHPALDSLGIQHLARTLDVEAGGATRIDLRLPTSEEIASRMCTVPVDFGRHAIIRFIVVDQATGAPLAKVPAVFSRVPIGEGGRPMADSVASYDITLDERGGFLACALRGDEVVRIEAVPDTPLAWGETVRPRAGAIGWHVIRVGRKR